MYPTEHVREKDRRVGCNARFKPCRRLTSMLHSLRQLD
jgi:hypothetical protein